MTTTDEQMFKENFYDCPIELQIGQLQTMMANEHEKTIMKAVQKIGIKIDQESLIEAINNDRKRYEEAYKKGYNEGYADGKERYDELLSQIRNIVKS